MQGLHCLRRNRQGTLGVADDVKAEMGTVLGCRFQALLERVGAAEAEAGRGRTGKHSTLI